MLSRNIKISPALFNALEGYAAQADGARKDVLRAMIVAALKEIRATKGTLSLTDEVADGVTVGIELNGNEWPQVDSLKNRLQGHYQTILPALLAMAIHLDLLDAKKEG